MFKPDKIIIHHSLTKDSGTVSWSAIRRYHTETLGWNDIGYHAGCEYVNGVVEAFIGRDWTSIGSHTKGQNSDSLGFCFVGNYDLCVPSDEMLVVGAEVINMWKKLFSIENNAIFRHSDFASYKSCPGTKFPFDFFVNTVLCL